MHSINLFLQRPICKVQAVNSDMQSLICKYPSSKILFLNSNFQGGICKMKSDIPSEKRNPVFEVG